MSEISLENKALTSPTKETQERFSLGRRVVAVSAALVLLAAACLKAWPLVTGAAVESQAASIGKLILIQGEALLAIWLISGVGAAWAFRAAILFFAGAAVVNLRSIWLGEGSCGCFGKVEVPPWVSLEIISLVISGLIIARPPAAVTFIENDHSSPRDIIWLLPTCILILSLGIAGALGGRYWQPMSTRVPDVIDVAPRKIDLGVLEAGNRTEALISVRNRSDSPVTILGAKTTCTCTVVEGLPYVVQAKQSHAIKLQISTSGRSKIATKILLYLHDGDAHFVEISLTGQVRPPSIDSDIQK